MTSLLRRLPSPKRLLKAPPLRILTGVAIVMVAIASYSTSIAIERLLFGLAIDEKQVEAGVNVPAMAFDGHSTGTLTYSLEIWSSGPFVSSDRGTVDGLTATTESLREILLPYYSAQLIDAVLVLALSAVVLLLCVRLLRGGPFVARTTASLAAFAALLAVGSVVSQLVRNSSAEGESGHTAAARQQASLIILGGENPDFDWSQAGNSYQAGPQLILDLFPLGLAVLIAVVATAFWLAHRMQRDTEGLV